MVEGMVNNKMVSEATCNARMETLEVRQDAIQQDISEIKNSIKWIFRTWLGTLLAIIVAIIKGCI